VIVHKYLLEIITVIAVISFVLLFLYTSAIMNGKEFSGSDVVGSGEVAQLSGRSVEDFMPLIPQYQPPSVKIESALFALQAAVGGIILGYVFGYWKCQKE